MQRLRRSQMDALDDLYDFLFGNQLGIHDKFVPVVSKQLQGIFPIVGILSMQMALVEDEEDYKNNLKRFIYVTHRITELLAKSLISIENTMLFDIEEEDR